MTARGKGRKRRRGNVKPRLNLHMLGKATAWLGAAWLILAIYVLRATLSPMGAALPLESSVHFEQLLPQYWQVFTVDPEFEYPMPYRWTGREWSPLGISYRGSDYGFDRSIRAQVTESFFLVQDLGEDAWVTCAGGLEECVRRMRAVEVDNEMPGPRVCGEVAIVKQRTPAWDLRSIEARQHLRATKVLARC